MSLCSTCEERNAVLKGKCRACYNHAYHEPKRIRQRVARHLKVVKVEEHYQSWLTVQGKMFMLADFTPAEGDPQKLAEKYNAEMCESLARLVELL